MFLTPNQSPIETVPATRRQARCFASLTRRRDPAAWRRGPPPTCRLLFTASNGEVRMKEADQTSPRVGPAPLEMDPEEFRRVGHRAVDAIAEFLGGLSRRPVTPAEKPSAVRALLGLRGLPEKGFPAAPLLDQAQALLFDHSLLNGHPRFWGYITSGPAPIGVLADLVASAVNPNVGAWKLAPSATEIEAQTVRWIAEFIGYPAGCGGLMVSGGNMANFVCFLAARRAKAGWNVRESGLAGDARRLLIYAATSTHTWIQKAADLFGHGTDAIRWIPVDRQRRLDVEALVGRSFPIERPAWFPSWSSARPGRSESARSIPCQRSPIVCRRRDLWFHVDGAYGAPAAVLPESSADLKGLSLADSVAVDPHKWLYSPLEAGCALVRDPQRLTDAFSFHPAYYKFESEEGEERINFHEQGPQNSRGFRALKVWLGLRQVGREGYIRMIREDCALARQLLRSRRTRGRARGDHSQSLHRDLPLRSEGSARPGRSGLGVPQRAQSGNSRSPSGRRRGVRLQRRGRRPVSPARLHRQFPHHGRRRRGASGNHSPAGSRGRSREAQAVSLTPPVRPLRGGPSHPGCSGPAGRRHTGGTRSKEGPPARRGSRSARSRAGRAP